MFKLDSSPTYTWPVKVERPEDNGKFSSDTSFMAIFNRLKQKRLRELTKRISELAITDPEICTEVVAGWTGITLDGKDFPFSKENLELMLDEGQVAKAIVVAFFESVNGPKNARAKN